MENVDFELRGDYVALCDLLKIAGVVTSGGEGKARVDAGGVMVDGQPESRRTAKIRAGQVVECDGVRVKVRGTAE
ncbi:RNA-binding S4 domain-containing protein [Methyloversatilis sp. MC4-4]|uniref:RNA-binding S4 domain-containing protein n=1 Tax=Methyloversatilis sp. MC4-4 TaxID=3132824 RepID=UPI003CF1D9AC